MASVNADLTRMSSPAKENGIHRYLRFISFHLCSAEADDGSAYEACTDERNCASERHQASQLCCAPGDCVGSYAAEFLVVDGHVDCSDALKPVQETEFKPHQGA